MLHSVLIFFVFHRIDQKMSGGQSGYELCEAKAILSELKSIRKAISSGEREKQDLMKVFPRADITFVWIYFIVRIFDDAKYMLDFFKGCSKL